MMQVIYINDSEVAGAIFCRAILTVKQSARCEVVTNALKTTNVVLDSSRAPDYIFIHAHFKDIPCIALVALIKEQSHLSNTKVIVIAEYVTLKDLQFYKTLDVEVHLKSHDITNALNEIIKQ